MKRRLAVNMNTKWSHVNLNYRMITWIRIRSVTLLARIRNRSVTMKRGALNKLKENVSALTATNTFQKHSSLLIKQP